MFGSSLGNAIGGDNVFARIGVSTVLGTVLQNVGETIGGVAAGASVDDAADAAIDNIGNDFGTQLRAAGVGTVSSFLTAELADEIGLDGSGFGYVNRDKEFLHIPGFKERRLMSTIRLGQLSWRRCRKPGCWLARAHQTTRRNTNQI